MTYSHSRTTESEHERLLPDNHSNRSYTSDEEDREGGEETSNTAPLPADEAEAAWLAELARRPWYRRPSVSWLAPFLFFLALSSGLGTSPSAQLSIRIICREFLNDPTIDPTTPTSPFDEDMCKKPEVLAAVALILSRIGAVRNIFALMTMAWWTSLSDKYGRIFLMKFSMVTVIFAMLLLMFAASPNHSIGILLLYADGLFRGLTASGSLFNPAIFAYVADCTSTSSRSKLLGYTLVAYSLGGAIGPYLGGYIARATGRLIATLWISVSTFCVLHVYLFFMPESLPPKSRSSPDDIVPDLVDSVVSKSGSPLFRCIETIKRAAMSMVHPFSVFFPSRVVISAKTPTKYTPALLLLSQVFLSTTTFGQSTAFYPLTNLMFKWDTYEDGIFFSSVALASAFTFMVIFPLLQRAYKRYIDKEGVELLITPATTMGDSEAEGETSSSSSSTATASAAEASASTAVKSVKMDLSFYVFGVILSMISYVIFPIFRTVPALVVSELFSTIAGVGAASGISLMSAIMPSDQTGMVMGAMSVVDSICSTVAGLAYSGIFAKTSTTMPWAIYYLSLALAVTSGCVSAVVFASYRRNGSNKYARMS